MSHEIVDVSNWQKQLSQPDAAAMRAGGVEAVAIGRQWANRAHEAREAAAALDAGLGICGEYWINVGGAWPEALPESKFVAIDVEPGSEFTDEASIDDALAAAHATGRVALIYSSAWAWDALGLGWLTKYGEQGVPLWDAHYDGRADGFTLPVAFGGWTDCVIDQYTEAGVFGIGYPVDRDAISDEFWTRCYGPREAPAWAVALAAEGATPAAPTMSRLTVRTLDQGESIAALEESAHALGASMVDNGATVVELSGELPPEIASYLAPGGRVYAFTTKGS